MFDIVKFVKENQSLSGVLICGGVSAFFMQFSMTSLIVHLLNLGLLFGIKSTAGSPQNNKITGILFFLSLGLVALTAQPNKFGVIALIIYFVMMMGICWTANKEAKVSVPATRS